jgi:hypothetical protein
MEAEEPITYIPNPNLAPVREPAGTGIGVFSVNFTPPGDDPQTEIAQLQEMGTLTDGLRKTLSILQRALSMQLDSNVSTRYWLA